jgi:hypothetical protein
VLGWSLGASQCGHRVGTPDGGVDSRHEWRDSMRMAADGRVDTALDRDPCPGRWARSVQSGRGGLLAERNKVGHGEQVNGAERGLRKENGRRRAGLATENRPKGTTGLLNTSPFQNLL